MDYDHWQAVNVVIGGRHCAQADLRFVGCLQQLNQPVLELYRHSVVLVDCKLRPPYASRASEIPQHLHDTTQAYNRVHGYKM